MYLDKWEKAVNERRGFSKAEKKRMMLSSETLLGLRMTGTWPFTMHACIVLCCCNENFLPSLCFSQLICSPGTIPVLFAGG